MDSRSGAHEQYDWPVVLMFLALWFLGWPLVRVAPLVGKLDHR